MPLRPVAGVGYVVKYCFYGQRDGDRGVNACHSAIFLSSRRSAVSQSRTLYGNRLVVDYSFSAPFLPLREWDASLRTRTRTGLPSAGLCSLLVAAIEHCFRLRLVTMRNQPLAGLGVQVAEGGAACNHHPHGVFGVGGLAGLPLMLGYKKFLYLLHIAGAQDGIEMLAEVCVFGHILLLPVDSP